MPPTMSAKAKMMLQQQQELESALRAGKTGVNLLDDAEINVGNSTVFQPQVLPPGLFYTTIPQSLTNNARVLNLTASSRKGQSMTIVMTASKTPGNLGRTGPFTGIVEFGNGTQTTRVEFDVPFGPFTSATLLGDADQDQPQDSGAIIQVPAGALRVYGRYDNAFLTPEVGGWAFGGADSPVPLPPINGPFAPNIPRVAALTPTPAPLNSKAFAAYFGRLHTRLYKTQYLYVGANTGAAVTFYYVPTPGAVVPAYYCVPPFAKSVRIVREPQTAAMVVSLLDTSAAFLPAEEYDIPGGSLSPVIPIEGNESIISVRSASGAPADAVYFVKLVYEIAF